MKSSRSVENLEIAGRSVGAGSPTFILAEVAQAHDGSLGMAHAFIEAAVNAKADGIKFQTHIAEAESTLDEPFRVNFSCQDATRYDYWKRMEFTIEQWSGLAKHAHERGLIFLSTAFSLNAFEMLAKIGIPAWKVGSGEFRSLVLLEAMVSTGAPILFSTGLANWDEITRSVAWLRSKRAPFAMLQCTSLYPTPLETVGLNVIERLRCEFGCPVGLSDHSGTMYPGLAAIARGIDILEVHVTLHRGMFGPDTTASVTFDELSTLCCMRDASAVMDSNPVDKDLMAERLSDVRQAFGRSLAPRRFLPAGTIITAELLDAKKPGGGIPPEAAEDIQGRRLVRSVLPDRILNWSDLAEEGK